MNRAATKRRDFSLPYKKVKIAYIKTIIAVILLYALIVPFSTYAFVKGTIQARVMQVKDGDTIVVAPIDGGPFYVCRLYGIDAPETARRNRQGQPFGDEATKHLKSLILGQTVEVETTGAKTHNREVCIVRKDGQDINLEMVRSGYAWAYRQFLKRPHASEYINAENQARSRRLGLWRDNNPVPPWEFRKFQKKI